MRVTNKRNKIQDKFKSVSGYWSFMITASYRSKAGDSVSNNKAWSNSCPYKDRSIAQ